MDLTRCNLGKFLVVPTFVVGRLQVRVDNRAPSGEIWNYLSRSLSCNVEYLTPSTMKECTFKLRTENSFVLTSGK